MTAPPLVLRAGEDELATGRLLHALAAQRGRSRVGLVGAAGAAWVVSALPPHVPVRIAEGDAARARGARSVFADDENVVLLDGGVEALTAEAPFDLLVLNEPVDPATAVGLLAPGGTLVASLVERPHAALLTVELAGVATLGVRTL